MYPVCAAWREGFDPIAQLTRRAFQPKPPQIFKILVREIGDWDYSPKRQTCLTAPVPDHVGFVDKTIPDIDEMHMRRDELLARHGDPRAARREVSDRAIEDVRTVVVRNAATEQCATPALGTAIGSRRQFGRRDRRQCFHSLRSPPIAVATS